MKTLIASIFAVAALASAAHAGTYVGVGVGTGAHTDGGMGIFDSNDNHSGRLVVGDKLGMFSIEGGLGYMGLGYHATDWNAMSLGVAGKINVPITPVFEAYVRLGLESTRLSGSNGSEISGSGWTDGLGVEYHFAAFGLFADYSKHTIGFDDPKYDGAATMFTIGATFGI